MKRKYLLKLFLMLLISNLSAQVQSISGEFENMTQESVFLHLNTSLLFSGESLKYKVYCLNNGTKRLSHLSRMAYVSLVGRSGEPVFVHKIRLQSGIGQSDFFVPTQLPTGSYKLVGYTQWMKNNSQDNFFMADIQIINPYQQIPSGYLLESKDSTNTIENSISKKLNRALSTKNGNGFIEMSLANNVLENRSMGKLKLSLKNGTAIDGSYSLSIRKLDLLGMATSINSEIFFKDFLKKGHSDNQKSFLPELRGETISGRLLTKADGSAAKNKKITLSLPGEDYIFKVSRTDLNGRFSFTLNEDYNNTDAFLQLLSNDFNLYTIDFDKSTYDFKGLEFLDFKLGAGLKKAILERSVQNQIENAYNSVKVDSIIPAQHPKPFYRNFDFVYDLDDYTRFNSLSETIIEIADKVSIKTLDSGNRVFQVRPEEGFSNTISLPLVFVDGLFLNRHEDFMDFSAKKIKSIHFSRDKYLVGSEVFQGIILFKTIKKDFANTNYEPGSLKIDLFRPQQVKEYFVQSYSDISKYKRVPDFRNQLLWMPNIEISGPEMNIGFYTSDLSGDYEIVLEGFTSSGKPVSLRKIFKVKA